MKGKGKLRNLQDSDLFKRWFEEIYNHNFERLYRYAFSITKSRDLAEDVVEEVFLNIWNRQDGHTSIRELDSYLYVSVKHLAIRMISQDPNGFLYSDYEESLQVTDAVDPESLLLGNELRAIISEVTEKLPPHCALVYDMLKNRGMSYEEVAQELGVSRKTVENHLNKALAKIRDRLKDYFEKSDSNLRRISGIGALLLLLSLILS